MKMPCQNAMTFIVPELLCIELNCLRGKAIIVVDPYHNNFDTNTAKRGSVIFGLLIRTPLTMKKSSSLFDRLEL